MFAKILKGGPGSGPHAVGELYRGHRIYTSVSQSSTKVPKFVGGKQTGYQNKKLDVPKYELLHPEDHKTLINPKTGEASSDWAKTQYWSTRGTLDDAKKAVDALHEKGLSQFKE